MHTTNTDPTMKTIQAATMAPILVIHSRYTMEPLYNVGTIGIITAIKFRIWRHHTLEDFGIFPVGMAKWTHAVERNKGVLQSPPLYNPWVRKGNQRLVLWIPVLLYVQLQQWQATLYERHTSVHIILNFSLYESEERKYLSTPLNGGVSAL